MVLVSPPSKRTMWITGFDLMSLCVQQQLILFFPPSMAWHCSKPHLLQVKKAENKINAALRWSSKTCSPQPSSLSVWWLRCSWWRWKARCALEPVFDLSAVGFCGNMAMKQLCGRGLALRAHRWDVIFFGDWMMMMKIRPLCYKKNIQSAKALTNNEWSIWSAITVLYG